MYKIKNIPFAVVAATGYLLGNLILTFQGLFEGRPIVPSFFDLQVLDPSSWQSLGGVIFIIISINTYMVQKFPHGAILVNAVLQLLANTALLVSGYTQEAFFAHAIGFIPAYIAIASMFQGNKINNKKSFYSRYPVACAATLFLIAAPPLLYNSILSQDWTFTFVIVLWCISHVFFALTDQNLQKKLFY